MLVLLYITHSFEFELLFKLDLNLDSYHENEKYIHMKYHLWIEPNWYAISGAETNTDIRE